MKKTFDVRKTAALVGAPPGLRIRDPEKQTCDGCGRAVFFSHGMIEIGKADAARDGLACAIVCMDCAQPFFADVANNGGVVSGTPGALSDVLPHVFDERRKYLGSIN